MDHGGILKQLFAAYPYVEVPRETVAVYLKLLADIPAPDLQAAVDDAICESEFMPTVALIRQCHEDRIRWRIDPANWIVGEPPKALPAEPEPVRLLREIDALRDAAMHFDGETLRVAVRDVRMATAQLANAVARTLKSAGVDVAVEFVTEETA